MSRTRCGSLLTALFILTSCAQAAIALDKKDYRALTELGAEYQEKGDNKRAMKYLSEAVKAEPLYPLPHLLLGKLYYSMREEEKAVQEFQKYIDIIGKMPPQAAGETAALIDSLHYISDVCGGIKRFETMKLALDLILRLDPKDQSAIYNLGIYYYNGEHNRPKAYQSFKSAAYIDPNTSIAKKAKYAIEFMRNNPDSRVAPDLSFINQEYRE